MAIYIGNTAVSGLYIGEQNVSQVYIGETLVFDSTNSSPLPTRTPTPTPSTTPLPSSSIVIQSNTANIGNCAAWNGVVGNVTDVGTNGGISYYGTYDQSGNIWEWTEGLVGSSRVFRGGNWQYDANYASAAYRNYNVPTISSDIIGGRIASYNNPMSITNMVNIGDVANTPDNTGYGSVNYAYSVNKFELTNNDYVIFLNAIAKTDQYGLYNSNMSSDSRGGIVRSGFVGSYVYSVKDNMGNKPVNYISWLDLARYVNWLHNNRLEGSQSANTTEDGAYDMSLSIPIRKPEATYFIPSEDEWYKAAFYNGSFYWDYATQSNTAPACVSATSDGSGNI